MLAVWKKDLHHYFVTWTGYLFMACILLAGGIFCFLYNVYYQYADFTATMNNLSVFFVVLLPIFCAGIFTEEKKRKTEQLLYTLPLTSLQIVLGKYLAMLVLLLIPMAILGLYPFVLSFFGEVNFRTAYGILFSIFLLGAALSAICMFLSALTDNLAVSGVLCFGAMFILYMLDHVSQSITPSAKNSFIGFIVMAILLFLYIWWMTRNIFVALIPALLVAIVTNLLYRTSLTLLAGKVNMVLSNLAVFSKNQNFLHGIFDWSAVVYYSSIAVLFVLFTVYAFEKKRWRA